MRLTACLALGLALGCAGTAHAQSGARSPAEFPVATDAKLEQAGESVRLTMALSRPVEVAASVLAGPDRVVIDLPSINFQVQPAAARKSAGVIGAFRFGLFTADKARIIIDLAQPAIVVRAESRAVRGGFGELVIELRRATRAEFLAAVAKAPVPDRVAAAPAPANPVLANPLPGRPAGETRQTIVIDPGHGGIDPGAVVASIAEKAVVLAFGLRLKEQLEASGRYRVLMTRDDDRFVPLAERVGIARAAGADLFISIHADSLTQAQEVRGATIYTGSERATDTEAARLAAKENQADSVAGLDASEDTQDVAGILMDLAKRETRTFSSVFARNLVETLGGSVKLHKVPLRSAGFRVLSAPDVPSVLIELGYMSSPKDAELLNSVEWRVKAVAAVGAAVDGYFTNARAPIGKAAEHRP
ncbi:N-acetylmuramoyl-L-alanine amidase [Bosea sp. (in: a-proteobacteria)]|uniref:N-acetylmuramoyl-L-alanine amidase n=1 Tax=Bosea sp. (in: a-proteobacteria) TaxID=1871050 RepID=UPI0027360D58|nr:N-acetylmuramoyl-L-alanine amidase [Bosea sp. (in: a-proteobacteria)]MDP3407300.1 N-acetylmuramoyl-L-alanine amidase [Bosea sp. (in: a-proteobacteria)]